jgi:hypothetical protein
MGKLCLVSVIFLLYLKILVGGGHMTGFVHILGNQKSCASFFPCAALRHLLGIQFNRKIVDGKCRFSRIFSLRK